MVKLNIKKVAKFKCLKCGHGWKDKPGPTQCPKCGHLFVKWVNYEMLANGWRSKYKGKYY